MSSQKQFGSSMFGFNKNDVDKYIEKISKEAEEQIKAKDLELSELKGKFESVKAKYDELSQKAEQIETDRVKISSVLIRAEEQAAVMMEEARQDAADEKAKLEGLLEQEKENLIDIKQEIRTLRGSLTNTLQKFHIELGAVLGEIDSDKI